MQWNVSVIEPDSQRVRIVQNSFGLTDLDKVVTLGDGRSVLAGVSQTYDIILIDYISANYPDSLLTREFFAMASSRLTEGGILGIVIESLGWRDESVKAVARTLSTSFLQVTVLPIVEPPDRFCPIVLIASNTARNSLLRDPDRNYELDPDWRYGPEYQKVHAWDNHFTIEDSGIPIQTDLENSLERVFTRIRKFRKQQPAGYLP
jgi:spermidine synthase